MRIALAQINPTIADFDGNRRLVLSAAAEADLAAAELVVFPELALCGYPPKDLLERPGFVDAAAGSLDKLAAALAGCRAAVLVGFPERVPAGGVGRGLSNSAALIEGGKVTHIARKSLLPTYDVFDEWRYFDPAVEVRPIPFRGRRLGVSICEDIWNDADFWPQRLYRTDPIESLVAGGAEIIVNVSASPYTIEKRRLRPRMLAATARRWRRPLVFVNQVGGQDDLVFDGASLAFDAAGGVLARGREHESDLVICDIPLGESVASAAGTAPANVQSISTRSTDVRSPPSIRKTPRRRWGLSCSGRVTTRGAVDFRGRCSDFRGGSIRPWSPASRPGPWVRGTSSGWRCRRAIRPPVRWPTPKRWRATWARSFRHPHRADVLRVSRDASACARDLRPSGGAGGFGGSGGFSPAKIFRPASGAPR